MQPRRIAIVARWPIGLARVTWRYLWRTVPVRRTEAEGGPSDLPPPVPPEHRDDRLGRMADGSGPLLHRRYRVLSPTGATPEEVIAAFAAGPNRATPSGAAVFVKTSGEPGGIAPGDEFVVRMPGPWDGPVRVVAAEPGSFRMATLRGHLEIGQIAFRSSPIEDGVEIGIESWARAADRVSHLLYNRLRLAKEIQLNLWVETVLAMAAFGDGERAGAVTVETRRVEPSVLAGALADRPDL